MNTKLVLVAAALASLLGSTSAFAAAPAVATKDVNLRAGPSTRFPVVRVVPTGGRLVTFGCLSDHSWCDVRFAGVRGWLAARYIFLVGPRVVISPAVAGPAGIPVVAFNRAYWRAHYAAYPWFHRWPHYVARPVLRRGPRVARPGRRVWAGRGVRAGCLGSGCSGTRTLTGPGGGTVTRSVTVTP